MLMEGARLLGSGQTVDAAGIPGARVKWGDTGGAAVGWPASKVTVRGSTGWPKVCRSCPHMLPEVVPAVALPLAVTMGEKRLGTHGPQGHSPGAPRLPWGEVRW